jgi:hypothetical protein
MKTSITIRNPNIHLVIPVINRVPAHRDYDIIDITNTVVWDIYSAG